MPGTLSVREQLSLPHVVPSAAMPACYDPSMFTTRDLRERLAPMDEIAFAYLFGSRGRGQRRPDSDWDVAVYAREDLPADERFALRLRLLAELDELGRVDVVILNDAPPLLAHRAIMGERLLVRDEVALVRFSVRTVAASEDGRYWRELHRRARIERLRGGTFGRP
jgi:predicted nucleotidyltransferase